MSWARIWLDSRRSGRCGRKEGCWWQEATWWVTDGLGPSRLESHVGMDCSSRLCPDLLEVFGRGIIGAEALLSNHVKRTIGDLSGLRWNLPYAFWPSTLALRLIHPAFSNVIRLSRPLRELRGSNVDQSAALRARSGLTACLLAPDEAVLPLCVALLISLLPAQRLLPSTSVVGHRLVLLAKLSSAYHECDLQYLPNGLHWKRQSSRPVVARIALGERCSSSSAPYD